MKAFIALALLIMALLAYGCGDSGETTGTTAGSPDQSSQETAAEKEANKAEEAEKANEKPVEAAPKSAWGQMKKAAGKDAGQLLIPTGPSPKEVEVNDVRVGKGPEVEPNDVFKVRYTTFDYATGKQIEQSPKNPVIPYLYEENSIVRAWMPGLEGIRLGGLRQIISPSRLAYGTGPVIYLIEITDLEKQ